MDCTTTDSSINIYQLKLLEPSAKSCGVDCKDSRPYYYESNNTCLTYCPPDKPYHNLYSNNTIDW